MSRTVIFWQLRMLHVKTLSFLTVMNVSYQIPCILDGYERFSFKKPDSTNGVFCRIRSIPLLFPFLLLTYKSGLWDISIFPYVLYCIDFLKNNYSGHQNRHKSPHLVFFSGKGDHYIWSHDFIINESCWF